MCTRGFDLNIFDLEWLACTPAYGGLALDDLSGSFGHGNPDTTRTTLSMAWQLPVKVLGAGLHPSSSFSLPFRPDVPLVRMCRVNRSVSSQDGLRGSRVVRYDVLPEHLLQACKSLSPPPSPSHTHIHTQTQNLTPKSPHANFKRPPQRLARASSAPNRRPSVSPPQTPSTFSTHARHTSPIAGSPQSSSIRSHRRHLRKRP
jgi:hypothetical protein